jgi:uncharacterized protein (TIGR02246 family)
MDDTYRINLAKTDLRDAYLTGDVDRLLSVFQSDGFTNMSEGEPSKYGREAISRLREETSQLFDLYSVQFTPIIIAISVLGPIAYDYGWHEFVLTPKAGGPAIRKRQRYFDLWSKNSDGAWKIALHINNADVPEQFGGVQSTWFLSETTRAKSSG